MVAAPRICPHIKLSSGKCSMSPGSSGGGLFDVFGNLIGITTLYIAESGSLNFAIAVRDYWKK